MGQAFPVAIAEQPVRPNGAAVEGARWAAGVEASAGFQHTWGRLKTAASWNSGASLPYLTKLRQYPSTGSVDEGWKVERDTNPSAPGTSSSSKDKTGSPSISNPPWPVDARAPYPVRPSISSAAVRMSNPALVVRV